MHQPVDGALLSAIAASLASSVRLEPPEAPAIRAIRVSGQIPQGLKSWRTGASLPSIGFKA